MIITGYQGIGKSSLAATNERVIDLESSNFWKEDDDGVRTRPDDWYVYYCQIAQDLSKQGYIVFVSCHEEVRKYLSIHNTERFCVIFPSKCLKEQWLKKLRDRYASSNLTKDLKAYEHAKLYYDNDIKKLWYECQYNVEYYRNVIIIDDINYSLQELVDELEGRVRKDFYRYEDVYTIYFRDGSKKTIRDYHPFKYTTPTTSDIKDKTCDICTLSAIDGVQVELKKRGIFGKHQLCIIDNKTCCRKRKYWEEDIEKVSLTVNIQKCFYTFDKLCREQTYDKIYEMIKDKIIDDLKR